MSVWVGLRIGAPDFVPKADTFGSLRSITVVVTAAAHAFPLADGISEANDECERNADEPSH